MSDKRLGFIGLGMMGGPMAINLLDAGYELFVLDTREEALAPVVEKGGQRMATPAEVASQADTVMVSLPTPDVVRTVALGENGLIVGSAIKSYIDLSTTGAVIAKEVAAALGEKGIQCLDAPVSGGGRGAAAGTLAIMVSGPKAIYEAALPALEVIGRKIFYVGAEPGMGQTVKVANNFLSATSSLTAAEALVMGTKAGLDPEVMLNVINVSSGRNNSTEDKFPVFVLPRDFRSMRTRLGLKDLTLCTDQGEALGVPMWLANSVRQFYAFAVSQGHADESSIGLIRIIEKWAGVEVKGKSAGGAS